MFYNIPVIWLIQTHLLTDSHTPNLEMLSHLKIEEAKIIIWYEKL